MIGNTDNSHYNDTRYNDKIRYTDNLNSTETLSQEVTVNQKVFRNIIIQYSKHHMFWIFVRIASYKKKRQKRTCSSERKLSMVLRLLTLVLLNPDIPCLCQQCRSRSVGFFRSQLIWNCTVCH